MSSFAPEDRLLHFRFLKKLGQGGMGEVYLAEDLKLGRKVALKVLPFNSAASDSSKRRLLQEARSASALNHQNIVTIFSIERSGDIDFIVMEYVEGETLSQKISAGSLPFPKLVDYSIQIAEGLAAAHRAGVIHRDIKPSNILVTNQGRVKILDFGLAKITLLSADEVTGDGSITEEGSILGTVYYMSPEQVEGKNLDSQSDLFSFGSLLYEAATGMSPFRGTTPASVMYQIVHGSVVPPSSLRPDLPVELDAIVLRALAREKSSRYTNAQDIADDLSRLLFQRTEEFRTVFIPSTAVSKQETFVGRELELEKLQKSFLSTLQSSGKVVFLTGEPGIGKSALAEHFLSGISMNHPNLFIGRGRSVEHFGTGEAYLPFLDAVSAILNSPAKQSVIQVLRQYAPSWCMQFPAAFSSTDVLELSQKEAASASKERMLRELSEAFTALSANLPLILFLEDLHWADPSSIDLLRYLSKRIQTQKILILATLREEDLEAGNPPMKACRLDLKAHSFSEEIHMNLLSQSQVREYLDQFCSPNTFPEQFSSMIFKKTEGQPLFVAGLLQYLVNEKQIEKQNQVWVLTKSLSESDLDVPENVRGMITRKIDALSEEDRRTLQFAAIEGEEFHSIVLADLLNVDEIGLEEELNRIAKNYGLIARTGEEDWPDRSIVTIYRFTHGLYQNAFYSDLITKRRMQLHRLAGESLLKHYGNQASSIANTLALHFRNGRDSGKAVVYLEMAGDHARGIYANAEAESLFGQALNQAMDLLKADPGSWTNRVARLHEKRADALSMLGKQDQAKEELESAILPVGNLETIFQARLHRKLAKVIETQRGFPRALELYQKAEEMLELDLANQSEEWKQEWLQIYLDRNWLYYTQNLQQEMQRDMVIMEPFVLSFGTPLQRFHYYRNSVLAAYRRERYRISLETLALVDRARQAAKETGVLSGIAEMLFVSGFAHMWHGDLQEAEELLKSSLTESQRLEDAVLQSRSLTYLTVLYRMRGNESLTKEYAGRALDHANTINMKEYVAAAIANECWLRFRANEFEQVIKLAEQALQIWKSLPVSSPFQSLAVWPLIAVQMQQRQVVEAYQNAELLLKPAQRPPDPEVEELLRTGMQDMKSGLLEPAAEKLSKALSLVVPKGYL